MPSSAWKTDVCSRSEEYTSELQSLTNLVCPLLLEKNNYQAHFTYGEAASRNHTHTVPTLGDPGRRAVEQRAAAGVKRGEAERNPAVFFLAVGAPPGLPPFPLLTLLR